MGQDKDTKQIGTNKNSNPKTYPQNSNNIFARIKQSEFGKAMNPYAGIICFVLILIVSHFFWKFTVLGDETDRYVTFFGMDISAPFIFMSQHVAFMVSKLLDIMNFPVELTANNIIRHDNGIAVMIVWSCTGLKQAYIFTCIILFNRGSFKKKLWFIPLGLVLVYLFNIARIAAISAFIKTNPEWFYILHEHVFKYLFYAMIFGLWVIWEEWISKRNALKNN